MGNELRQKEMITLIKLERCLGTKRSLTQIEAVPQLLNLAGQAQSGTEALRAVIRLNEPLRSLNLLFASPPAENERSVCTPKPKRIR
jgi:hypothetical protein